MLFFGWGHRHHSIPDSDRCSILLNLPCITTKSYMVKSQIVMIKFKVSNIGNLVFQTKTTFQNCFLHFWVLGSPHSLQIEVWENCILLFELSQSNRRIRKSPLQSCATLISTTFFFWWAKSKMKRLTKPELAKPFHFVFWDYKGLS